MGYNTQWDGAVIGIEGTYNWMNKSLTATNRPSLMRNALPLQ